MTTALVNWPFVGWLFTKQGSTKSAWKGECGAEPTEFQLKSFQTAGWAIQKLKGWDLSPNLREIYLHRILMSIIFLHFTDVDDLWSGYSISRTLADAIRKAEQCSKQALLPHLDKILTCKERDEKAALTYQFVRMLMSGVFDSSGGFVNYCAIRVMLNAPQADDSTISHLFNNEQEYLEPLGFTPHHFEECGKKYTTWYWKS